MSCQISCGFKNLDKLGVRIKKIKNTLLVGFFKNQSKSNIFIKEITCKFYREFFCKFYRDFYNKIEGDFNFKGFLYKMQRDNFFLCCPLPYNIPSGSSARTLRRGRQAEFDGMGWDGWSKVFFNFFILRYIKHYTHIYLDI